ncbi:Phosphoinositide phosphatase sac1 [Yamadazyma tenuis]|uniref:SAC domain-containing protein n=1 Tax=Candida tenuis (strain ATCC 10573 / BCRC 21748 / CBS 615 / JCM 9827 / NBRC 10315 / NRRL Y-1498 / VKM Y-70) TaxID=590646 RepID=G3BDM5_CANTC|nr:uncharacterized protein CANTEDRAFT_111145 [Yamadazyma tenuis ATCC 10573]EGV60340.1 hypothetical protein CANTEDRAFT_111145 [Yamadazyma tenuis ATCC 10573]WEJ94423.1 Phosphoinositide phosphatase sac1 [Yamadazyma tenuis]
MSLVFADLEDSLVFLHKSSGGCLVASNGVIGVKSSVPSIYKQVSFTPVSCIIGLIRLKVNSYLIIANSHEDVGQIMGETIGRVSSYKILPINKHKDVSSNQEETNYLKLVKEHLNKNDFYFAVNNVFDLTNNLQTQYTEPGTKINSEFWWNKYLSESLLDAGASQEFITPIINGYVKSKSIKFAGSYHNEFNYILITRKSNARVGTRYFRRGIDNEGNVANFNETEQIIFTNNDQVLSFLQIRGSVPLYWSEINNLCYKPNLVVSTKNAIDATVQHFSNSVSNYGEIFCVNLVNNKGYELPIKEGYESIVNSLPSTLKKAVHYVYFDFHHECKNMKFENADKLIPILENMGFDQANYFHYDFKNQKVVNLQKKCVRTNCMDCLDRTNVVQSILSRYILQKNFSELGYLDYATPWKQVDPEFNFIFQNIWADNADAVSRSYSSTPALKTDFTRLGKRTIRGSLSDLNNSIIRYYNNNYHDGVRQDSFDLFLGKFKPYESVENPFIDYRPNYIQLLPYLLTTSFLILFSMILYPKGSLTNFKNLLTVSVCLAFQFNSFKYILANSYQFVNWPNLVNLDFLTKTKVRDSTRRVTGIKYDTAKDFKVQTKKSN